MILLALLACALLGAACYQLSCAFVDVPTRKTSKAMLLAQRQGVKQENILDVYITRIAAKLERFVRLDPIKKRG